MKQPVPASRAHPITENMKTDQLTPDYLKRLRVMLRHPLSGEQADEVLRAAPLLVDLIEGLRAEVADCDSVLCHRAALEKSQRRIDAFRRAIANAELGEGPAFNMAQALREDDVITKEPP